MKKTKMIMLAAAMMLAAACSSSDDEQQQSSVQPESGWSELVTLTAGTPGNNGGGSGSNGPLRVKVDTSNPQKSQWETGDQLTVWTGDACSTANMSENGFALISGADTGTGKFSGRLKSETRPASDTKLTAVIDNENDAIDASAGNSVSANLSVQKNATAESVLDYELYYATSTNGERNFTFTHKMALIGWKIKVNGASDGDKCDIVLKGTGLKNSATLDPATGTLTPGADDGTITLKDVTLTSAASTTLYVVLPPCTVSSGISATLAITSDSNKGKIAFGNLGSGSITVAENRYYDAGPNEFTLQNAFVDLGLPSGLLWATTNIGATSPQGYGDYFAWGETEPYYTDGNAQNTATSGIWKTGKEKGYASDWSYYFDTSDGGSTFSKYDYEVGKTVLESADDAATANWGSAWRMPTHEEWQELANNCHWEWTTGYNGTSVKGYIVYATKAGGSYSLSDTHIFLPAAGYRYDTDLDNQESRGYYWSSELYEDDSGLAWFLYFRDGYVNADDGDMRYDGLSVRPVLAQ